MKGRAEENVRHEHHLAMARTLVFSTLEAASARLAQRRVFAVDQDHTGPAARLGVLCAGEGACLLEPRHTVGLGILNIFPRASRPASLLRILSARHRRQRSQ